MWSVRVYLGKYFPQEHYAVYLLAEAICNGFGITMSQFFCDGDMVELTPELSELFEKWVALTPEQKTAVYAMLNAFTDK